MTEQQTTDDRWSEREKRLRDLVYHALAYGEDTKWRDQAMAELGITLEDLP